MPNQPTFPYPYFQPIDMTETNVFKCLANPKDTIESYKLIIKSHMDGSELAYIRGGIDENNNQYKYYKRATDDSEVQVSNISSSDSTYPVISARNAPGWINVSIPEQIGEFISNGTQCEWVIQLQSGTPGNKFGESVLYAGYSAGEKIIKISTSDTTKKISVGDYLVISGYHYKVVGVGTQTAFVGHFTIDPGLVLPAAANSLVQFFFPYATSQPYYFTTMDKPMIDGFIIPEVVHSPDIDVSASYSQAQGDGVKYYRFDLYSEGEIVDTTGNMYFPKIEYSYNGLLSGATYTLELTVETDSGYAETLSQVFSVSYDVYSTMAYPTTTVLTDKGAVDIDITANSIIKAVLSEQGYNTLMHFKDSPEDAGDNANGVELIHQTISYNKMNDITLEFPEQTTFIMHWRGTPGFAGDIIGLESFETPNADIRVGFDGRSFWYSIGSSPALTIETIYDEETLSAIIPDAEYPTEISENKEYVLEGTDEILASDHIISNSKISKFWWFIFISPNSTVIKQGTAFYGGEPVEV